MWGEGALWDLQLVVAFCWGVVTMVGRFTSTLKGRHSLLWWSLQRLQLVSVSGPMTKCSTNSHPPPTTHYPPPTAHHPQLTTRPLTITNQKPQTTNQPIMVDPKTQSVLCKVFKLLSWAPSYLLNSPTHKHVNRVIWLFLLHPCRFLRKVAVQFLSLVVDAFSCWVFALETRSLLP